ncbi:MAG: nuclear transport factor 2 family protein [Ginsengibacter sp.]
MEATKKINKVQENLKLMHTYFDALFGKDIGIILNLMDDNIEWLVVPTGDSIKGKEKLAAFAKNHWAGSPGRVKKLINVFASEDFACLEYSTIGVVTKAVDFPSIKIAPSGNKYEFSCCFVFHIINGKIDRVREYFDMATVQRQLGTATDTGDNKN